MMVQPNHWTRGLHRLHDEGIGILSVQSVQEGLVSLGFSRPSDKIARDFLAAIEEEAQDLFAAIEEEARERKVEAFADVLRDHARAMELVEGTKEVKQ